MATAMLTQDLLGICMFLSNGDIHAMLQDILCRAEAFQRETNRHFGISRDDLGGSLRNLVIIELGWNRELDQVRLSDVALHILSYDDVYFNDEGEHWNRLNLQDEDEDSVLRQYGYDREAYLKRVDAKCAVVDFFKGTRNGGLVDMKLLLQKMQIDEALLYHCSRAGGSH